MPRALRLEWLGSQPMGRTHRPRTKAYGVSVDTDTEEFQFADRYLAAQTWAIAAALTGRHPDLRTSAVVNEVGAPLVIVHDDLQTVQVQFDLLAWILFAGGEEHLYWDEVFGHEL